MNGREKSGKPQPSRANCICPLDNKTFPQNNLVYITLIRCVAVASVFSLTGRFMTHRNDAASHVLDRWRMLAEQRLNHLTELFESGRWRRYHSERTFLENIKEAKEAVEIWRSLAAPRPVARAASRPAPAPSVQLRKIEQAAKIAPRPIELPVATETEIVPSIEQAAAPVIDLRALERALEVPALDFAAMERRYPLLRNTL
ncbi:MAG TPA: TIGR03809 family protein [Bradyrhizobium sp.]|jgi:uncharacterized repeat protein (TIGR03809 family)